jgi:alkylation response protein AidB-like acyl-CoA dehydrogenase
LARRRLIIELWQNGLYQCSWCDAHLVSITIAGDIVTYQTPLQDIRFILSQLIDMDELLALPGLEDFDSDTIGAVLEENARFAEQVIAPLNRAGDLEPARMESEGRVTTSPGYKQAFAAFAQGSWQGLQHDQAIGGQGLPKVIGAATSENINAANLAFSLCPLLTDGVIEALAMVGDPGQQALYIPPMLEGRWTGTMNLTEPQAGSDLARVATRAVRQDDQSYRISGQKIFITYGEHDMAENIIHLVLARTPDAPKGVKGISLFLVPKYLADADGKLGARNDVWCASLEHKLGIHGSPTCVLLYGDGKGEVGEGAVGYLIGEENRGLEYMFIMMNAARYAVGLQGIAVAERAFQQADAYAKERVQGQPVGLDVESATIDRHPDVQRMLLTMRSLTEAARAIAYVAAVSRDIAGRHADTAVRARHKALYEFLVPVVKGYSTEMAVEVTSLGIQVHGGMGYIEETGAAQYYRDARILPIYEGTTAIQANDFIGRKVLRDGAAVVESLMADVRETVSLLEQAAAKGGEDQEGMVLIAQRLLNAVDAQERATASILVHARNDVRAVFTASVPYLMLTGTVLGGWQMARAALACQEQILAEGEDFRRRKMASCVLYAAQVLPRAQAWSMAIEQSATVSKYADAASAYVNN